MDHRGLDCKGPPWLQMTTVVYQWSQNEGDEMDAVAQNDGLSATSDDIVWEVKNIAKVIRRTERQTFHLLSTGQLPARQIGNRWVASRKKLLAAVLGEAA